MYLHGTHALQLVSTAIAWNCNSRKAYMYRSRYEEGCAVELAKQKATGVDLEKFNIILEYIEVEEQMPTALRNLCRMMVRDQLLLPHSG